LSNPSLDGLRIGAIATGLYVLLVVRRGADPSVPRCHDFDQQRFAWRLLELF